MNTPSACERCGSTDGGRRLGGSCTRCVGRSLLGSSLASSLFEAESPGVRVGPYTLVELVGEGGGGVVYSADQEAPIRRRVALKIIKPGMDTQAVVARFGAERQALALMDHPHIAKIFDAGATSLGRPFFVMEWVPGARITDFCQQYSLSIQARIELFILVCEAVQHAHQKGVIHRDIKPSNILVAMHEGLPVPKVIDFGIAKAFTESLSEDTLITEDHQHLGTPGYMSPEQILRGGRDLDTRSDIYSLGVVLYELLTGVPPFDLRALREEGPEQARKAVCELDPVRPTRRLELLRKTAPADLQSRINGHGGVRTPSLSTDLDWIVMKCLEKDRASRYETADALAQDLRRHLDNDVVSAAAPTVRYRVGKFARRNRVMLAVGAAVLVILLLATIVSLQMAFRASEAEGMALQRLGDSETARIEAEAVSELFTEILTSAEPSHGGRSITVAETLERTVTRIEADPGIPAARRARFQAALGGTYRALGYHREATALLEAVRDYRLAKDGPIHTNTLNAMSALSGAYHDASRFKDALDLSREVAETRSRVQGSKHPDTLLAKSYLAWSLHSNRQMPQAIALEEEVLKLSRKVNGTDHPDTIQATSYLGWFYSVAGRNNQALPLQEKALANCRTRLGVAHPTTLNAMTSLAVSQGQTGKYVEAIRLLQEGVALSKKIKGPAHPETLWAMGALADVHLSQRSWPEAKQAYEEILALSREANGPNHARTLWAIGQLAKVERK